MVMVKTTKIFLIALVVIFQSMHYKFSDTTSYAAAGDLKVEFYSTDTKASTNTIYTNFKIKNTTSTSIDLSEVKLRYYYTRDTAEGQNFWCDFSSVGKTNITGSFVFYPLPYPDADCYLEIGFSSGAGVLLPGDFVEIQSRISKFSGSNYNQLNDYSYCTGSSYTEWSNVTAYIGSTLAWGTPPAPPTPTPTVTSTPTPVRTSTPTPANTLLPTSTVVPTSTPIPTDSLYFEAESASLYRAEAKNKYSGYTGTGYVEYDSLLSGYIQWTANVSHSGKYLIQFRYAYDYLLSVSCQITVNGKVVASSLSFPRTSEWTTWSYVGVNADLIAGSNTIKVQTSNSLQNPIVDHMKITLVQAATPTPTPTPTPTLTPTPTTVSNYYEAESAIYSSASTSTKHAGYTGTGFVDFVNQPGGYIHWNVNASQRGVYQIQFRYSNNGTDSRPANIIVNDQIVTPSLSFPSTGDWTVWTYTGTSALLNAGNNTIRILATGNEGGANIDHIKITFSHTATPTPTSTPTPTPTPLPTPTPTPTKPFSPLYYEAENAYLYRSSASRILLNYTGTGYVENEIGSYMQWTVNVSQTGIYSLQFRYITLNILGNYSDIIVNDQVVKSSMSFPINLIWSYAGTNATLNSGDNTIRVKAESLLGGPYIDHMKITLVSAATPTPTLTPTPTPTPTPTTTPTATVTTTPVPTNAPAPEPTPGSGIGLRGEYYDNMDFTDLKLTRIDSVVDFDWGQSSPDSSVNPDTFSVIWSGEVQPRYSENYTFYTVTDDGVRLWVNDVLLINNWTDHSATEDYGNIILEAGKKYKIILEYYENSVDALSRLMWCSESQGKEVIPQSQLYPPKAFTALEHNVISSDNAFAVGDYIPLTLKVQLQSPVVNPVISVDLNILKPDGSKSGFILKEILSGTSINKNMFRISRNESNISPANFSVWTEGSGIDRTLKIKVFESFQQNDILKINYTVKASAVDSVYDTGIKEYLNINKLNGVDLNILFEIIVEKVDSGIVSNDVYSKDSTSDLDEKQKFKASIKLEDPIQFE